MNQAIILSWDVHAEWLGDMVSHKILNPTIGCVSVSWEQLNNADIEIYRIAASQSLKGIRPTLGGDKPLNKIFLKLIKDPRVTFFLMPLPMIAKPSADTPHSAAAGSDYYGKQSKPLHTADETEPSK